MDGGALAFGQDPTLRKDPCRASLKIVESSEDYATLTDRPASLPDPVSGEDLVWHKLRLSKGGDLPALDLRSLNSQKQEASAVLKKGTSYFLNLWATWCGPCRKEMPELESLRLSFQAKGIQLLGISLDQEADSASVEAFARKLGVSYPLYRIDEADIQKVYGGDQAFVPLSVLVDEKAGSKMSFQVGAPKPRRGSPDFCNRIRRTSLLYEHRGERDLSHAGEKVFFSNGASASGASLS